MSTDKRRPGQTACPHVNGLVEVFYTAKAVVPFGVVEDIEDDNDMCLLDRMRFWCDDCQLDRADENWESAPEPFHEFYRRARSEVLGKEV